MSRGLRAIALLLGIGCQGGDAPPRAPVLAEDAGALVARRPYRLLGPAGDQPLPLVITLHGYGAGPEQLARWFDLEGRPLRVAILSGTPDSGGHRFWNAGPACCDFEGAGVDDVAYVAAVIEDARRRAAVDPARIWVIGFSNGGFLAHRLACELPVITGAVAIAGNRVAPAAPCPATRPVVVLHVHGDADPVVSYDGGEIGGDLPRRGRFDSAEDSATAWATAGGCASPPVTRARALDLDEDLAGADTTVTAWSGCRPGAGAALWRIHDARHVPGFGRAAGDAILAALDGRSP